MPFSFLFAVSRTNTDCLHRAQVPNPGQNYDVSPAPQADDGYF
jgi:hypothetical protein